MTESGLGAAESARQTYLFGDSGATPTSPHQLFVREIPVTMAQRLNRLWHSHLPEINLSITNHRLAFGFFCADRCFAVAIWSSPIAIIKDNDRILELRRYAIAPDAPPNTASWGLGVMIRLIRRKWPAMLKLVSYQDTAVHEGTIYKASNWKPAKKSSQPMGIISKKGRCNPHFYFEKSRAEVKAQGDKIRWEYEL